MFSVTVKFCTSLKCWCTMPMPNSPATFGFAMWTSRPLSLMTPASALYRPKRMLIRVDLPAPFSPRSARISPFLSWMVISSLASIPGKRLVTFSISTI